MNKEIIYSDFYKGIAISKKVQSGFDDLINCDVDSEIGSLKCQKTLVKMSGNLITAGCYQAVAPNGDTYFFSKDDGRIWKRTQVGIYSYVRTNTVSSISHSPSTSLSISSSISTSPSSSASATSSPSSSPSSSRSSSPSSSRSTSPSASPSPEYSPSTSPSISISPSPSAGVNVNAGHKSARYYRGYIYYTTDTYLGRFNLVSTWNDYFQPLISGYNHPMEVLDLILYIGNGRDVAQLDDAEVFSSSGLDLPTEYHVTALIGLGDDLLTLANPGDYINDSAIFRWNTYSDSWTIKDSFFETNAYAFLNADNYVYVVATSGQVYFYNGSQLETFSQIREPYATYGHQLTTNLQGKPLIANGGKIYSLFRKNRNLPVALVGEYTCSAGADATIHSIQSNGSNLLVSWESEGTFGIDEISPAYYANARIVTPRFKKGGVVKVYYDKLNTASVGIYSRLDGETNWTSHEVIDDSDDFRFVRTTDSMIVKSGAQVMVTLTPNSQATPSIDYIQIENI